MERKKKRLTFDSAIASEIGSRVRIARKSMGLSQESVAKIVGVTRPHLSYMEVGKCVPSGTVILGLSRALGMSPNEILGWEEPR
jgi:transcriptional regulator with XRE-family HTH domain